MRNVIVNRSYPQSSSFHRSQRSTPLATDAKARFHTKREVPSRYIVYLTGDFCTSGSEREFTLEERWYAHEEIQAGANRNAAAAD
jgi:hypothetical protein